LTAIDSDPRIDILDAVLAGGAVGVRGAPRRNHRRSRRLRAEGQRRSARAGRIILWPAGGTFVARIFFLRDLPFLAEFKLHEAVAVVVGALPAPVLHAGAIGAGRRLVAIAIGIWFATIWVRVAGRAEGVAGGFGWSRPALATARVFGMIAVLHLHAAAEPAIDWFATVLQDCGRRPSPSEIYGQMHRQLGWGEGGRGVAWGCAATATRLRTRKAAQHHPVSHPTARQARGCCEKKLCTSCVIPPLPPFTHW
jgi:hypothetical protein